MGYLPVYGEVPDKCVIKKVAADGVRMLDVIEISKQTHKALDGKWWY